MANLYVSPQGVDTNTGSEQSPWKTLAAAARQATGNPTILVAKGTYAEPMPRRSGVHWKAQAPGETLISGGIPAGSGWTKDAAGTWSKPWTQQPFGAFQGSFEKQGKWASYFWRDYNQRDSNPMLDINPADPASQFKFKGGKLYLRTIGGEDPNTAGVMIAVRNVGIDLGAGDDGDSDVTVEGFTTRYHGSAVGTGRGKNVHFIDCDFGYCGKTGVWLTKLTGSSMENCVVQGAGNWAGHYEDVIAINGGDGVILRGVRASWGGHSGVICLGAKNVRILGCLLDTMGGSGITLKQGSSGALIEGNTILRVAGVAQLTVHRVPHAAIQGSMDDATIRNNILRENGLGFLLDSTNVQSCRGNLIVNNTVEDCEGAAVDLQENEDPGGVEGNIFRANIFRRGCLGKWADGSPQTRLIFVAFANRRGLGANMFTDNFWDRSGSISLNGDPPSATNDSSRTDNRGATASAPPPPPPPQPPDPPVPPNPPPTGTKPRLDRLRPASGPPGTKVTAEGAGFGVQAPVIVSVTVKPETPEGKRRMAGIGNDTSVAFMVPFDAVTGDVQVRRGTVLSNPLPFDVTGSTPTNKPPVARINGPSAGVVGQSLQFDGSASSDPDGTIVKYEWVSGLAVDLGPRLTRVFTAPGIFDVTLTVTDNQGATATATTTATITAAPPPGALQVFLSAEIALNGAVFRGTIQADAPLPPGSTIRVIATLPPPDGRTAEATWIAPGTVPPPPPVDGNRIEDVFEFMGSPADQALLRSAFDDLHYPWGSMKPGLQRVGLKKVRVEFADLSWAGAALTTMDGEKVTRATVEGHDDEKDDHLHVVWGGMLPGVGGDVAHYVVGLAWTSGLLQIEQSVKGNTALVKQVVGFEGAHHTDFFFVSLDGDGPGSRHARLLELAFAPAPVTGQWWGGHYPDASYFRQCGESWMAALAIAYGDNPTEDRRFSPFFKISHAAQIRAILGLSRTDGKG